jgi:hypothetical protein
LTLSEVDLPNPQNYKYARYEITADFKDTNTGRGLLPTYSINDREGHLNYSEAANRAIASAEKRINSEYKDSLETYLSQLSVK